MELEFAVDPAIKDAYPFRCKVVISSSRTGDR